LITTWQPSWANALAAAKPIPLLDPATKAFFPFNPRSISILLYDLYSVLDDVKVRVILFNPADYFHQAPVGVFAIIAQITTADQGLVPTVMKVQFGY
jgi:hypothetical protein